MLSRLFDPKARFRAILMLGAGLWLLTSATLAQAASAGACTACHANMPGPAMAILKTKHGVKADSRTPQARQGCSDCHGPSLAHLRGPTSAKPDRVFGSDAERSPVAELNAACLGCHQGGAQLHWRGSVHDFEQLACNDCHQLHVADDPVLAKATQAQVCFSCHAKERAESRRPFHHPMAEGQMSCSDCHNPHGSHGPTLLIGATPNETCYGCHAEKRGPFLWEHPPVSEDCGLCHRPHGSNHQALLTARAPWLCQQCHLAQFHPSTAYSGDGLPGTTLPSGSRSLLGQNCMNCHSHVHGSNHPSGPRQTR